MEFNVWHVKKRGNKILIFFSVRPSINEEGSYAGIAVPADIIESLFKTTNPDALMKWYETELEVLVKRQVLGRWTDLVEWEDPTPSRKIQKP